MDENKILKTIGNNIKTARVAKNITQQKLAEQLNVSDKFISMIERGCCGVSLTTIIKICKVLNIDPNFLFTGLISHNDSKDTVINNSLLTFSSNDKDFLINVINYITGKNSKN